VRMVVQATGLPPTGPLSDIEPAALGAVVTLKVGGLLRLVRAVDGQLVPGSRIVAIAVGRIGRGRPRSRPNRVLADKAPLPRSRRRATRLAGRSGSQSRSSDTSFASCCATWWLRGCR
jgi:hypothetical protein